MLKILWKRREIAPKEQFLLLSTIFCYLMLDFYVKTRVRSSLRDKRLFEINEINEVEITRVDCIVTIRWKKDVNPTILCVHFIHHFFYFNTITLA